MTTTISERITALQTKYSMNDAQVAEYLGVPVHTLRNWRTGKRVPAAVVYKLLDVLGILETLAPAVHEYFVPPKG